MGPLTSHKLREEQEQEPCIMPARWGGGLVRVSMYACGGAIACVCHAPATHLRVPVAVKDDDRVCGGQVDAKATRARGEQEGEVG